MCGVIAGVRSGLLILAGLVVVVLVASAPASAYDVPHLGPASALSATDSGSIEVELPKAARLSNQSFDNPNISIDGSGPVAGFTLRRLPLSAVPPQMVVGVRAGNGGSEACGGVCGPDDGIVVFGTILDADDQSYELPAGRYVWSAITAGAPLRVSLRLPSLTGGSVQVEPLSRLGARVRQLTAQPGTVPGSTLFAGTETLTHQGVVFTRLASDSEAFVGHGYTCLFEGAVAPSAFEAECDGAMYRSRVTDREQTWAVLDLDPGPWSAGGNISGSYPNTTMVAAWIPTDVAPPPPPPPPAPAPEPRPVPVLDMRLVAGKLSARIANRRQKIAVRLRSTTRVTALEGRLITRQRVVASGRIRSLDGAATLTLRLRRHLVPRTYKLKLRGTDSHGRRATRSFAVRVSR